MTAGQFDVGGRRLGIRHLDRVLFPRAGTRMCIAATASAGLSRVW